MPNDFHSGADFRPGKGQRFASVWDALPPGLRDDALLEQALFDASAMLASQKGLHLVRACNGYRLTGQGVTRHYGDLSDAATYIRRATKQPLAALAGAVGATAHVQAENPPMAVFCAMPIGINNWTDATENAT